MKKKQKEKTEQEKKCLHIWKFRLQYEVLYLISKEL